MYVCTYIHYVHVYVCIASINNNYLLCGISLRGEPQLAIHSGRAVQLAGVLGGGGFVRRPPQDCPACSGSGADRGAGRPGERGAHITT